MSGRDADGKVVATEFDAEELPGTDLWVVVLARDEVDDPTTTVTRLSWLPKAGPARVVEVS